MKNKDALETLAKTTAELNETNKLLVNNAMRSSLEQKADFAGKSDSEKNAITALYASRYTEDKQKELEEKERKG